MPHETRSKPGNGARAAGVLALATGLALLAGCAIDPAHREATERAWAERDRERAAECAQRGGRYLSSSCLQGSGP